MAGREYLNFDLELSDDDGGHVARVLDSPAGEATARFELPFTDEGLENFVLKVGRTRSGVRRFGSPQMEMARSFGSSLYEAAMTDEVETTFRRAIDAAGRDGRGLRVRLRITGGGRLQSVPWEYMYSRGLSRFIVLSAETPLVRYVDLPNRPVPLTVDGPLEILLVVSSPTDVEPLDTDREVSLLRDATGDLIERGLLRIDVLEVATLQALRSKLRKGNYHVLHFIGHGAFDERADDGLLVFEDANERAHPVSGHDLGMMLHDHNSLRLLVLNACEGSRTSPTDPFAGVAQALVKQGLPAVVGMQFEITDVAAITFAHELYAAVVDGYPIDAATAEARKAIFASGNDVEWGTPVLHMRATDGVIFDTSGLTPQPPGRSDQIEEIEETEDTEDTEEGTAGAGVTALEPGPPGSGPDTATPEPVATAGDEDAEHGGSGAGAAPDEQSPVDAPSSETTDGRGDAGTGGQERPPRSELRRPWVEGVAGPVTGEPAEPGEQLRQEPPAPDDRGEPTGTDPVDEAMSTEADGAPVPGWPGPAGPTDGPPSSLPPTLFGRDSLAGRDTPAARAGGGGQTAEDRPGEPAESRESDLPDWTETLQPIPVTPAREEPGAPSVPGSRRVGMLAGAGLGLVLMVSWLASLGGDDEPGGTTVPSSSSTSVRETTTSSGNGTTTSIDGDGERMVIAPGETLLAASAERAPDLDGEVFGDWPGRWVMQAESPVFGGGADVAGEVELAWDAAALYVGARVVDAELSAPHADDPDQLWRGDSVSFEWGTAGSAGDAARAGDLHVMIGPVPAGDEGCQMVNAVNVSDGAAIRAGDPDGRIEAVCALTGDGYVVEAAVPWGVLGVDRPEAGNEFLMNLNVSDATEGGDLRVMVSTNPDRHQPDRTTWQTIRLD